MANVSLTVYRPLKPQELLNKYVDLQPTAHLASRAQKDFIFTRWVNLNGPKNALPITLGSLQTFHHQLHLFEVKHWTALGRTV